LHPPAALAAHRADLSHPAALAVNRADLSQDRYSFGPAAQLSELA
jgi:hypothetical protein